jgi:hypothetical protein
MRALVSGVILANAACSGGVISLPLASSTDVLASQRPGFIGGIGAAAAAAATSATGTRTENAARRIATRRMNAPPNRS